MTITYTLPTPLRTITDSVNGAVVHQLLGPEASVSLYFTQPTWTADGRYFLFLRKSADRAINYWCVDPDGSERQLTHFSVTPNQPDYLPWMHRLKLAEENERFSFLWPAIHPTEPLIVFPLQNVIYLLNVQTGECQRIHEFETSVSEQGFFAVYQQFSADGKHLIFSTAARGRAIDPPYLPNDTTLKDEHEWEGRLWRYNFVNGEMEGELFASNGEQAHLLTCPWDPDMLLWANYKHACLYAMRRDGTGLRSWFIDDPQAHAGHYNWDVANRSLMTLISNPLQQWQTTVARINMETGDVHHFDSVSLPGGQWHQNTSPDGQWIVMDRGPEALGFGNALYLLHQATDTVYPLCRIDSSWGLADPEGRPVKSEWLHPNPVFTPDGRYVVFHSDFGSKVAHTYAVDLTSVRLP
jgi:hypothetical protein